MNKNRFYKRIRTAGERLGKRFGSRRVLVVYLICLHLTILTMILSVILTLQSHIETTEKMIEHIALCVLAIILLNIPVVMQTRFSFRIPAFLQIIVEIFIVAHCVLGEIYRFYDNVFLFDKILHTTAGIIIAVLGFSIVYGFSQTDSDTIRLSPFFVALFSFCFALALITLWEGYEFGMDALFGTNMQRWEDGLNVVEADGAVQYVSNIRQGSGLIDTMSDLIVGIAGALFVSVSGGIWVAKNPHNTKFYVIKSKTGGTDYKKTST